MMNRSEAAVDESQARSRYVIGIDLGTTNSALCYVDTHQQPWRVETLAIPQWVDVGQYESLETLPSFHFEYTADEAQAVQGRLPWESSPTNVRVGVFARDAGLRLPGRRIASAKSWLSHDGVDRTASFLPWQGDPAISKLSPVEASARYLSHLRDAWNHAFGQDAFADQDVVITLPASFDEVARELTIAAAKRAGLNRLYLIEEPQAAFYAWLNTHAQQWQSLISPGQMILVCDIGGGTTDFTLIRVQPAGPDSEQVQFHRVAVGNHLILGGDNFDLALARYVEHKLQAKANESDQAFVAENWEQLVAACRLAKETMLHDHAPESYSIHIARRGSRLIGGALQVTLTAEEIDRVLVDGFFPQVPLDVTPDRGVSGFREFGLPYAADAAITKHLATFLSTHRRSGLASDDQRSAEKPDWILFNGGVMSSAKLRDRITDSVARWFRTPQEPQWQPTVLASPRLDLAVAQGAAYYAMVRRGEGIKIAANLGRAYYVQVASDPVRAICLIPGNAESGDRYETSQHPLTLQIGEPARFPLWVSSTRLADRAGELVELQANEASRLPPIVTALQIGKRKEAKQLRVMLESTLSEIGTVEIWCVDLESERRWKLEFDVRSTLETDREAHETQGESAGIVDSQTVQRCEQEIQAIFSGADSGVPPAKLVQRLQEVVEQSRESWPPSLLRQLWQALMSVEQGRKRSAQHEARWLNLVGYCLRPGYGVAVDDWRVSQTWKTVFGKLSFAAAQSKTEAMVLWRRIAGGMTAGQQQQLAANLKNQLKQSTARPDWNELAECWRLLGALERLDASEKVQLGRLALQELKRKKTEAIHPALLWALGRLGSRWPAYGPANQLLSIAECEAWIGGLSDVWRATLSQTRGCDKPLRLAVTQLALKTGDRYRDLGDAARREAIELLDASGGTEHERSLIMLGGDWSRDEQTQIFGDTLPLGIQLSDNQVDP